MGKPPWPLSAKITLLFPLALALSWCAARTPGFVERYYAVGFFPFVGQPLSRLSGLFPFSCAEFVVIVGLAALAGCGLGSLMRWRRRSGGGRALGRAVLRFTAASTVIYIVFLLLWGLNYRRAPFAQIAALDTSGIEASLIDSLCVDLIRKTNELRAEVPDDDEGVMRLQNSLADACRRASIGFERAAVDIPQLQGAYGQAKPVGSSLVMSWLGIQGIYFPFTAEANINTTIPSPSLPATICHEMAHQRGFAREDEANYIAYLTCRHHPDSDFRYSGHLMATLYVLSAIPDRKRRDALRGSLHSAVKRDLEALRHWRERYASPFAAIASRVNDTYLRSQGESEGVRSYGRMVQLLAAEWRATR